MVFNWSQNRPKTALTLLPFSWPMDGIAPSVIPAFCHSMALSSRMRYKSVVGARARNKEKPKRPGNNHWRISHIIVPHHEVQVSVEVTRAMNSGSGGAATTGKNHFAKRRAINSRQSSLLASVPQLHHSPLLWDRITHHSLWRGGGHCGFGMPRMPSGGRAPDPMAKPASQRPQGHTMLPQWLPRCHHSVATVVTPVSAPCYHGVTAVSPRCYRSVTKVLPQCYHSVTTMVTTVLP